MLILKKENSCSCWTIQHLVNKISSYVEPNAHPDRSSFVNRIGQTNSIHQTKASIKEVKTFIPNIIKSV